MFMRPVRMLGSSALMNRNADEDRIRVAREWLFGGVGVCLLTRIGVLGLVICFPSVRGGVREDGRWIHSVDGTEFAT